MQKLFENWRRYQKELNETTGAGGAHEERVLDALASIKVPSSVVEPLLTAAFHIASFFDLTGITGWPFFLEAKRAYDENKTLANAAMLAVATMTIIPVIGKIPGLMAKGAHATKMLKLAQEATDAAKGISKMTGASQMGARGAVLANKIDDVVVGAEKTLRQTAEMPMQALDSAFKSGIMNVDEFSKWYYSKVNRNASWDEVSGAWAETKKLVDDLVESESLKTYGREAYGIADSQFHKIIKKYGFGVDPHKAGGGYIISLAESNPVIYNNYLKSIGGRAKETPVVGTVAAVAGDVARSGGKRLTSTLFHEIGHIEFIKRFSTVASRFLKEYKGLLSRRMGQIQNKYGLTDEMIDFGDELLKSTMHVTRAHQRQIIQRMKELGLNNKQIMALYQNSALKRTAGQIGEGSSKEVKLFLSDVYKKENYDIFQSGSKEIADILGLSSTASGTKFYFLNFEEVFAELFEKSVRKRAAGNKLTSKNFPETSMEIQKIIDREIIPNLRESLLRENKSKVLIKINRITI